MIETMLSTHSILVKVFLTFLILGLFVPKTTASNPLKFKKATFVYTLIFHTFINMTAFAGLVALVSGKLSLNANIALMIVIFIVMMILEIFTFIKIKRANLKENSTFTSMRSNFIKTVVIDIILTVAMLVVMTL